MDDLGKVGQGQSQGQNFFFGKFDEMPRNEEKKWSFLQWSFWT